MNDMLYPNIKSCIKDDIVNTIHLGDTVILKKSNSNTSNKVTLFKHSNKICIPNPKRFGLIPLEDYHLSGVHKYDNDLDIEMVIKR